MAPKHTARGFTLIELLVGISVLGVIAALAAPSFRDFILLQRLKSINAQVVTDLQWARSEAVSRGQPVRVRFQGQLPSDPEPMSCYVIYVDTVLNATANLQFSTPCNCKAAAGSRCSSTSTQELRTVQIEAARTIKISASPYDYSVSGSSSVPDQDHFGYDPRTGGFALWTSDEGIANRPDFTAYVEIDDSRKFANQVARSGRVRTCIPNGSVLPGESCP